jgi:hypothetical protein
VRKYVPEEDRDNLNAILKKCLKVLKWNFYFQSRVLVAVKFGNCTIVVIVGDKYFVFTQDGESRFVKLATDLHVYGSKEVPSFDIQSLGDAFQILDSRDLKISTDKLVAVEEVSFCRRITAAITLMNM